jgi:hypothetical protein
MQQPSCGVTASLPDDRSPWLGAVGIDGYDHGLFLTLSRKVSRKSALSIGAELPNAS